MQKRLQKPRRARLPRRLMCSASRDEGRGGLRRDSRRSPFQRQEWSLSTLEWASNGPLFEEAAARQVQSTERERGEVVEVIGTVAGFAHNVIR